MSETHLKPYFGALVAFAIALVASWIYWQGFTLDPRLLVGAAVLACFILASELFSLRVNTWSIINASDVGLIVGVAILGPIWAAVAALPADLFVGRRSLVRTVYEISHSIIIVCLAGIAFPFASDPVLIAEPGTPIIALYGTLVAGAVLVSSNKIIDSILAKVKHDQALHQTWKENVQPYLLSDAVNIVTAGLGALAWVAYGPAATVVVVAGSVGSQVLVYSSRERVRESNELRTRVDSLERSLTAANTAFGTAIIRELGRRDGYTHRHAIATAVYAEDLGREMKLDETCVGRLRMAGLLHNVGMFELPGDLLVTTGKLNSIAQHQLSEHPALGQRMLSAVPEFEEMASWVRWHHERPDGRGYPDKLRGPWIPTEAKILAVAQSYAAMVLDQPRRPGMDPSEARGNLSAGIDTQFDGVVVRAFLRILDTESEGYRMADDHRFVFPDGRPEILEDRGRKDSMR